MRAELYSESAIDMERYPIAELDSPVRLALLNTIHNALDREGCAVLDGFIRADVQQHLTEQSKEVAKYAYRSSETVNAYAIEDAESLPTDHQGRITQKTGHAFVARDKIPESHIVHSLCLSGIFQCFIADCFRSKTLYPMADPFAGLVINVLEPGLQHAWHFDLNTFTISLLTQAPESGGAFEYCPNIRTENTEHFSEVRKVINGETRENVCQLDLKPGDLQLFKGRYSLHRVAPVAGKCARHTAILSYCDQPGIVSTPEHARLLFGRALPVHEKSTSSISLKAD